MANGDGLSNRAWNCIQTAVSDAAHIRYWRTHEWTPTQAGPTFKTWTVEELCGLSERALAKTPNLGKATLAEIKSWMAERGLTFSDPPENEAMAKVEKRPRVVKRAATLTIDGPGRMTARGRRDIVAWLRQQAEHLAREGREYTAGRFRAGFNYTA